MRRRDMRHGSPGAERWGAGAAICGAERCNVRRRGRRYVGCGRRRAACPRRVAPARPPEATKAGETIARGSQERTIHWAASHILHVATPETPTWPTSVACCDRRSRSRPHAPDNLVHRGRDAPLPQVGPRCPRRSIAHQTVPPRGPRRYLLDSCRAARFVACWARHRDDSKFTNSRGRGHALAFDGIASVRLLRRGQRRACRWGLPRKRRATRERFYGGAATLRHDIPRPSSSTYYSSPYQSPYSNPDPSASPIPKTTVSLGASYAPGTIIINTTERRLYYVLGGGQALRYGIGVGHVGFTQAGVTKVSAKKEWPGWTPWPAAAPPPPRSCLAT